MDRWVQPTPTTTWLSFPAFARGSWWRSTGLMVHHMDIGGMNMANRGWGTEIYQEGLRIPPLKVVKAGRLDRDLLAVILRNTRTPRNAGERSARADIERPGRGRRCHRAVPQVRRGHDEAVLHRVDRLFGDAHARRDRGHSGWHVFPRRAAARRRRAGRAFCPSAQGRQERKRNLLRLHRHRQPDQRPHQQPAGHHPGRRLLRHALPHRLGHSEHRGLQAPGHCRRAAGFTGQRRARRPRCTSA